MSNLIKTYDIYESVPIGSDPYFVVVAKNMDSERMHVLIKDGQMLPFTFLGDAAYAVGETGSADEYVMYAFESSVAVYDDALYTYRFSFYPTNREE